MGWRGAADFGVEVAPPTPFEKESIEGIERGPGKTIGIEKGGNNSLNKRNGSLKKLYLIWRDCGGGLYNFF